MKHHGWFCLLAGCTLTLCAMDVDLSHYQDTVKSEKAAPKIVNPSFDEGGDGWVLYGDALIRRGFGTVASNGLLLEQKKILNPASAAQLLDLEPGKDYEISLMIRGEDVKGDMHGASFAVEFRDQDGKFFDAVYPAGISGTQDWKRFKVLFKAPKKMKSALLRLFFWPGCTGKAYFDDLNIVPVGGAKWSISALNAPMAVIAPGKTLYLIFSEDGKSVMNAAATGKLAVCADFNGKKLMVPIENDLAALALPADWQGSGELKIFVLDTEKKLILEKTSLPLTIKEPGPQPAASCRIDDQGFAVVDGKRFLPIGAFISDLPPNLPAGLKEIRDMGFNTVMPYNFRGFRVNNKPENLERIADAYDYCDEIGLKVIFSLLKFSGDGKSFSSLYGIQGPDAIVEKIVRIFSKKKALLAYYTCDELPNNMIPLLTKRRQQLNRLDPEHPTWLCSAIGYNTENMHVYGPTTDVSGIDCYPISYEPTIARLEKALQVVASAGLPYWMVPQMFSWHRIKTESSNPHYREFRFPTDKEFRSMILLSAGYGAKGFIFWDATAIVSPDPNEGDAETNRQTIKSGIGMLRGMEPFILSGNLKKLPVKASKGEVRAWEFADGKGGRRVAVVALGPGAAEAEITVDNPAELKSTYGNTSTEDGKLIFRAQNVDCDLLGNQ